MNLQKKNTCFWLLCTLCILSLFMFLGSTWFHTRGEPREAVVAFSMIDKGNWVLPVNSGVDMAYKPPFFHWCIAVVASVVGSVNEYTSRMPSALALSAMVLVGFVFYARRRNTETAFLAALITLTNFEVHRAGVACRVDMVLTAAMVIALFQLYKWGERGLKGVPLTGVLALSAAALTKGPVGIVLPCVVTAVFLWIRGMRFMKIFFSFLAVALLSCILPALWYYAAWLQGGEQFYGLVYEENVLRFLGKMSYESHINPAYYNVVTVVAGYVPYTLLLLVSLFFLHYSKPTGKPLLWWKRFKEYIRKMDDVRLFSLLSIVIIFVFYCIPKSKRSVYLLPIYPFIAYFLAEYILYLRRRHLKSLQIFGSIMAGAALLLTLVFGAVRAGCVPDAWFSSGRHAAQNLAYLHALRDTPLSFLDLVIVLLPVAVAFLYFRLQRRRGQGNGIIYACIGVIFSIFFALDGLYQPLILKVKSDKAVAGQIGKLVPEGILYGYHSNNPKGNPMRHFTVNFYLGDRIVPFEDFMPEKGFLFMGEDQYDVFMSFYGRDYVLEDVYNSGHVSCDDRRVNHLYRFRKTEGTN